MKSKKILDSFIKKYYNKENVLRGFKMDIEKMTNIEKATYLRNIETSELFVVIVLIGNPSKKISNPNIKNSYFLSEDDQLETSLLKAKKFDTEEEAETYKASSNLDREMIVAPLKYFVDAEIKNLK